MSKLVPSQTSEHLGRYAQLPKMNIFTDNLHSDEMDQYYILTRDDKYRKETKDVIQHVWDTLIELKLIGDNIEKFVKDAQRNFHGALWQLELTYILQGRFNLIPPKETGPDIIIERAGEIIIIDCVSSNISGINKVERIMGQVEVLNQDSRKLRVLESINKKYSIYEKWVKKGIVTASDKLVIAVDTSNIPSGDLVGHPYANIMESVLFGVGNQVFVYNHETGNLTIQYDKQKEIKKENGSLVTTNLFENPDFQDISGIAWKNTNFLFDHSLSGDNIRLYKNPKTSKQLSLDSFSR
ncbi:hypothetical protein EHO59_04740 [Leptospira semungkisensis]|uniref:Uncharacterized protein n=1 Tax=Leptospira semungkisensis TaxID=2484985 RepID=A0A4R9G729_9LEPT|nr:hypothetical protein [Leptospira semungkisensis]TGK07412.1 hypothetical protein EHO59_04740 [Leptospira semungkisensis]